VKKKLMIVVPLLLVVLGGAYKFVLAPKAKAAPKKVEGTLVPLGTDFVVNLAGGHYGKISVALLLKTPPPAAPAGAAGGGSPLEEDAAVRATITDELTGLDPQTFINRAKRKALVAKLKKVLTHNTDEPVVRVLLTDIAVQ
jgi:flagellar basal body-associated protein FliL